MQYKYTTMAFKIGLLSQAFIFSTLMLFQTVIVIGEPQVPCYFVFGDSLVDSGNNNRLARAEKANYPPYGVDFPQGVTGRFTNGFTVSDIIGELLGFPDPPKPTYLVEAILAILERSGINYGSAGAGIREETGRHLGARTTFSKQLDNHASIVSRLSILQRNKTFTNEYIKKCIYLVNIGSDDYVNNYLMPKNYPTSRKYTPDQYATVLIRQYSQQLRTLYKLGARKIAVFGLGFIGCAPATIAMFGTNGEPCVESVNNVTDLFNNRLKPLIDDLNNDNPDARFTFINITSISTPDVGVALPNVPCCQIRSDGQCIPNSTPCPDRTLFVWYDGYHPTEVANRALATRSYIAASPSDASPVDISRLAQL